MIHAIPFLSFSFCVHSFISWTLPNKERRVDMETGIASFGHTSLRNEGIHLSHDPVPSVTPVNLINPVYISFRLISILTHSPAISLLAGEKKQIRVHSSARACCHGQVPGVVVVLALTFGQSPQGERVREPGTRAS